MPIIYTRPKNIFWILWEVGLLFFAWMRGGCKTTLVDKSMYLTASKTWIFKIEELFSSETNAASCCWVKTVWIQHKTLINLTVVKLYASNGRKWFAIIAILGRQLSWWIVYWISHSLELSLFTSSLNHKRGEYPTRKTDRQKEKKNIWWKFYSFPGVFFFFTTEIQTIVCLRWWMPELSQVD